MLLEVLLVWSFVCSWYFYIFPVRAKFSYYYVVRIKLSIPIPLWTMVASDHRKHRAKHKCVRQLSNQRRHQNVIWTVPQLFMVRSYGFCGHVFMMDVQFYRSLGYVLTPFPLTRSELMEFAYYFSLLWLTTWFPKRKRKPPDIKTSILASVGFGLLLDQPSLITCYHCLVTCLPFWYLGISSMVTTIPIWCSKLIQRTCYRLKRAAKAPLFDSLSTLATLLLHLTSFLTSLVGLVSGASLGFNWSAVHNHYLCSLSLRILFLDATSGQ